MGDTFLCTGGWWACNLLHAQRLATNVQLSPIKRKKNRYNGAEGGRRKPTQVYQWAPSEGEEKCPQINRRTGEEKKGRRGVWLVMLLVCSR